MTAHELARTLLQGPDLPVTRRGYEGGVHEITSIGAPTLLHRNLNHSDYFGPDEYHDEADANVPCWRCDPAITDEPVPVTVLAIHLN